MTTRRCRRWLAAPAITVLVVLLGASAASAHVTVRPNRMVRGGHDVVLTFLAPNERDDAHTIELQVFFPENLPLLGVLTAPVPGWTAHVVMVNLAKPVETDDGPVSQVVSEITWTATSGGLAPGQYGTFEVVVGTMPDTAGSVVFKALQTYSSGEIVRWIQVPDSLDPTPDTPAPILTLTAPSVASPSSSSGSAQAISIAALACSVLALVGVGVLLAKRPHA
jgi:uncharacterized protein YcnI